MKRIRLGVNIDHVATLRQVRKARYPDIVEAALLCERGGADQITIHLREDRRHIQDADVQNLLEHCRLPINLEMAFTKEMIDKARRWQPYSVTLVPERREEMTTESGLDLKVVQKNLKALRALQKVTRVYGFIDPEKSAVALASELNLDGIEFHTGPFAHAYEKSLLGRRDQKLRLEIRRIAERAEQAKKLGLEVKAGHGLTIHNVKVLSPIKEIEEVNIGHAIVAHALIIGLEAAVSEMVSALRLERPRS